MKNWWWKISVLAGLLALLSHCKSTDRKTNEPVQTPVESGTPGETQQSTPAGEAGKGSDELPPSRPEIYQADTLREEAPSHDAPGQERIDSLKQGKTERKRK